MSFISDLGRLFLTSASGRKLHKQRADHAGGVEQVDAAATIQAGIYMRGLLEAKSGDRNFEDIAQTVPGANHQRVQHFISDAPWDESKVLDEVSAQANGLLGGTPLSFLIGDESGFSKKGLSSAGVARQHNGRLGKVDNCQVGVFVALAAGRRVTLLEGRLYLPEAWCEDPRRCEKAHIPEAQRGFKTKAQILLEMVSTQRARGVQFNWVSTDAGYGKDPAFLRALDGAGETFVTDVHASQRIWLDDPKPAPSAVLTGKRRSTKPKAVEPSMEVRQWAAQQPAEAWVRFKRRDGINGALRGEFLHRRIWVWDGKEEDSRCWHLIAWRADEQSSEIKYVLSNASADIAVIDLARMAASRFWVERALQDAKGAAGMAEYQMRSWVGWHRHMAMVMLAMLFMLRERVLLAEELPLLSAEDIAWMIEYYLPRPQATEAEIQKALARRHKRRQTDIDSRRRREKTRIEDIL
jgi:SRSO17 transposase